WNAAHAAGEVSRPLRHNAVPYRGINVVLLWLAAFQQHFTCPLWMTYKQAAELGGQVRKGAKGSLVGYADTFNRCESGAWDEGDDIHDLIQTTPLVFNADGLPVGYDASQLFGLEAATLGGRA